MRSEKEKMIAGELYQPADPELCADRLVVRERCHRFNHSAPSEVEERRRLLCEIFGKDTGAWIEPPFHCDYGRNIRLGAKVYFNFNCVVLDVAEVGIGDNVLIGPAVQIYTAMHPLDSGERRRGLEYAKPVSIGSDVWIGGGAVICPGVSIGDRTIIGAGSVVTRDIPPDVIAAGNPARIIREIARGES